MKRRFAIAVIGAMALAGAAGAEPPPYPEFTFKRVGLPKPGQKRITVQIAPRPAPPPKPPATDDTAEPDQAAPEAPASPIGRFAWYWDAVGRGESRLGPARLELAVNALSTGPAGAAVPAPRLQALQDIARLHGTDILRATVGTKVSPALVLAVIGIESSGRPRAVSPKGATGLMQLMPATAKRFGVTDITDPTQNIAGGVAYLDWLMKNFGGDPVLVLAGYNAGEGAVQRHGGVPPYAETRDYVPKVLAAWQVSRGLCITPPQLISDGCVFRVIGAG
ncbi:soluble lytic murein transglycosylase-like protein [Rhodovulum iodosum]|uniref:Soluble lytic murein transglycosylase-like protein n=1 Tax=Rhodovulum iodosum TaxID=68291 RepID=A0ABV3XWC8_9RHOB|nr:lytic transglycosylase domain-containing protein [Rhodovulum robiginosum]